MLDITTTDSHPLCSEIVFSKTSLSVVEDCAYIPLHLLFYRCVHSSHCRMSILKTNKKTTAWHHWFCARRSLQRNSLLIASGKFEMRNIFLVTQCTQVTSILIQVLAEHCFIFYLPKCFWWIRYLICFFQSVLWSTSTSSCYIPPSEIVCTRILG